MKASRCRLAAIAVPVSLGLFLAAAGASAQDEPQQTDVREEVETRLVQVDISVIEPGSSGYASVPGLTLDHFEIRLNGKRLTEEQRSEVIFDSVCRALEPGEQQQAEAEVEVIPPPEHGVIFVVDFNYVGARGRHRVATMLEQLAEEAADAPSVYKVYGLTRQVHLLTDGYTRDGDELRRAAATIRRAYERAGFTGPEESDIPSSEGTSFEDAVEGELPFELYSNDSFFLSELRYSNDRNVLQTDYRPAASVAGLEAIMRSNVARRGRKALILFSSEAFRFVREDRLQTETRGILELGREGFTIWTVDVEGVGRSTSGASELLSMLAQDTGGDSVRRTGDFMHAVERAEEQLSCYYLFSLPVPADPERVVTHTLDVRIDAEKYPDMWGWRVMAPSRLTVRDDTSKLKQQRMAALFAPDDYRQPPVTTTVGRPSGDRRRLLVNVRVPLDELTWLPSFGIYRARALVDAVVVRDKGRGIEVVCETNVDEMGILEVELPRPPKPGSGAGLTIQVPCEIERDGIYTARGVLTDIESGETGAGRSTLVVREKGIGDWRALFPRVRAVSGRDFVYSRGMTKAVKDEQRSAWRSIDRHRPAWTDDRIAIDYLLCGPDRTEAGDALTHAMTITASDGRRTPSRPLPADALVVDVQPGEGEFCAPASITFPERALPPGTYALEIKHGERRLGSVRFEIRQVPAS